MISTHLHKKIIDGKFCEQLYKNIISKEENIYGNTAVYHCFLCVFLILIECNAQNVMITFTVIVPPVTPKDAVVYIAGDHPHLGNWNPGAIALKKIDDSTWNRSFMFPLGQELEYKITLGSWESQALYHSTDVPANSRTVVEGKGDIVIHPTGWHQSHASIGIWRNHGDSPLSSAASR